MTLGQALSLAKLWKKHPSLIHNGLVGGPATSAVEAQEKPHYTTREEVNQLVREWGRKN